MKRKLITVVLAVAMVMSLFTGCGAGSGEKSGSSDKSVTRKIGIILYGKDDTMGSAVYSYLNYAANAIDAEITWAFGDYDAAAQLTTCQNMVAAGCEGILMMPMDNAAVQQVASYCEQNQVYFGLMFRDITDATIKETVENYDYYAVDGFEDDAAYAEKMIEYMSSEYGVKNFGQMSLYESSPLVARNDGFIKGYEKTDASMIAEFPFPTDSNTQTIAAGIENMINSYSNMDALVLGASSVGAGETAINTLKTLSKNGTVKLGTFDAFDGMEDAFTDGTLVYVAGGVGLESVFDFCVLYNAVDGTPLADDTVILNMSEIEVKSAEDCANYANYIDNAEHQILQEDEIKSMCRRYNEDASVDTVNEFINNYTLDWVVKRAK